MIAHSKMKNVPLVVVHIMIVISDHNKALKKM